MAHGQEKFSRWNDLKTGINPFIPVQGQKRNFARYILDIPLLFVRIPLLLMTSLLLLLVSSSTLLICSQDAARAVRLVTEAPLARFLLSIFGFFNFRKIHLRKNQVNLKPSSVIGQPPAPRSGDIILANHSSFIEVLYFAAFYSPQFLLPVGGQLYHTGFLGALRWSLSPQGTTEQISVGKNETAKALKHASSKFGGPIVIFAEGCRTNNSGILSFHSGVAEAGDHILSISDLKRRPMVHYYGFKYSFTYLSPTNPVQHPTKYMFDLLRQVYNSGSVYTLPASSRPQPGDAADITEWTHQAHEALAHVAGIKAVSLKREDCHTFLRYFASKC